MISVGWNIACASNSGFENQNDPKPVLFAGSVHLPRIPVLVPCTTEFWIFLKDLQLVIFHTRGDIVGELNTRYTRKISIVEKK